MKTCEICEKEKTATKKVYEHISKQSDVVYNDFIVCSDCLKEGYVFRSNVYVRDWDKIETAIEEGRL